LIVFNNEYIFSPIIKYPGRPGYPSEADLEKSEKLEE
jgi:hypothetical protein